MKVQPEEEKAMIPREDGPKENVYDDIIGLERWNPRHHARMFMDDRAAQFAPFAALVGFEELIGDVQARHEAQFEKD